MDLQTTLNALEPLGFTETEALVYAALVRSPDQTGYALAKTIQKGQPSIYAALAALEQKGAVVRVGGSRGGFAPIPPDELLAGLKGRFDAHCEAARQSLNRLGSPQGSEAVLQFKRADQVYERARSMIAGARETLVFELFPAAAPELRVVLEAAAARPGLKAVGLVLRPEDRIAGAEVIVSPVGRKILDLWPSTLLILIADAETALVAGMDGDGAQAVWTDSTLLSAILHNAIVSDILLHRGASADWIGPNRELLGVHPPGLRTLIDQA